MKQSKSIKFFSAIIALFFCLSTALTGCGSPSASYMEATTTDAISASPESEAAVSDREEAFYEIYKPYGVSFHQEKNELYFNGELVRCFRDEVVIEEGLSARRCDYFNEKGTLDIHTLREPVQNEDGSVDLFGTLKGIEKSSQEEFNERDLSEFYRTDTIEATTETSAETGFAFRLRSLFADLFGQQKSFPKIFKEYESYGITYEAPENGGIGNLYYNGRLVNAFIDQKNDGSVFSFHSEDGGEINVQTVYDDKGKLTDIAVIEK